MNLPSRLLNIKINYKIKIVINVFMALFTFSVLFYLVYSRWDSLKSFDWQINWGYALLSIPVYLINLLLLTLIWVRIVNLIGVNVKYFTHLKYYCISQLMKRLPGTVWYVPFRARMYADEGVSMPQVALTSGIEFAVFISGTLVTVAIFSVPILREYSYSLLVSLFFLSLVLIFLYPKSQEWLLNKIGISINNYPKRLFYSLIIQSFITRVLSGIILFLFCASITSIPLNDMGYIIGVHAITGLLSSMLFFSPNNFGFSEMTISVLLSQIMPSSLAVLVALINRFAILVYELVFAGFVLLLSKLNKPHYSKGTIDGI
jgi:uncharacterized membrane protein YbhN (UPF0104 family)